MASEVSTDQGEISLNARLKVVLEGFGFLSINEGKVIDNLSGTIRRGMGLHRRSFSVGKLDFARKGFVGATFALSNKGKHRFTTWACPARLRQGFVGATFALRNLKFWGYRGGLAPP